MIDLKILQEQLNCHLNKQIEWKLKLLKQKQFEGASKPDKLLAWQLKKTKRKEIYIQNKR